LAPLEQSFRFLKNLKHFNIQTELYWHKGIFCFNDFWLDVNPGMKMDSNVYWRAWMGSILKRFKVFSLIFQSSFLENLYILNLSQELQETCLNFYQNWWENWKVFLSFGSLGFSLIGKQLFNLRRNSLIGIILNWRYFERPWVWFLNSKISKKLLLQGLILWPLKVSFWVFAWEY